MALSNEELRQLGDVIAKAIKDSGSAAVNTVVTQREKFAKSEAKERDDILKETKRLVEGIKQSTENTGKTAKGTDNPTAAQKLFDSVAAKMEEVTDKSRIGKLADNLAGIKELPEYFKSAIDANAPGLDKFIGKLESMEDVAAAQQTLANIQQVGPIFEEFAQGKTTIAEASAQIRGLGFTTEQSDGILESFNKLQLNANDKVRKNTDNIMASVGTLRGFNNVANMAANTLEDFSDSTEAANVRRGRLIVASDKLKQAFGVLVTVTGLLYGNLKSAAKFGVELDVIGANLRGMQMGEWAETLAQSRQAVLSLSGGLKEFEGIVSVAAGSSLAAFTGSPEAAAKGLAEMVQTSRLLGDANMDSAKFVGQQTETYKRLHKTLAMTIDDFSQLNRELVNDTDIRNIMVRLSGTERQAKFKQLQQDYESYRTQGLLHDQAVTLTKTMDRMAGKDPKERMKDAARMSAAMGAVGMGAQAEEARKLVVKGGRRDDTDNQRLVEITKQLNEKIQGQKGESLQGELFATALTEKSGLAERLATTNDLLLAEGQAADERVKAEMSQRKVLAEKMIGPVGIIQTLLSPAGPIGAAIMGTALILGTALFPIVAPILLVAAGITMLVTLAAAIGAGIGSLINAFLLPTDAIMAIGGTIAEIPNVIGRVADKVMSPSSWFSDDGDTKKAEAEKQINEKAEAAQKEQADTQKRLATGIEKLTNTAKEGNDLAKEGNNIRKGVVDETKKGNALKDAQTQNENTKMRVYNTRQAFGPAQPA